MNRFMKATAAIMLMTMVVVTAGCKKELIENANKSSDYVNLGLPSGTSWATCNIGSLSSNENGGYFAWGETSAVIKNEYNWSTYKFYKGPYINIDPTDPDNANTFSKNTTKYYYYNDNNIIKTDNLTMLEKTDDAANVNWGADWCMPTEEQMEELIDLDYTSSKFIMDPKGLLIMSKINGETLFMPAAGERINRDVYYGTQESYYGKYYTASIALGASYNHCSDARGLYFFNSSESEFISHTFDSTNTTYSISKEYLWDNIMLQHDTATQEITVTIKNFMHNHLNIDGIDTTFVLNNEVTVNMNGKPDESNHITFRDLSVTFKKEEQEGKKVTVSVSIIQQKTNAYVGEARRCYGRSVRPVRAK